MTIQKEDKRLKKQAAKMGVSKRSRQEPDDESFQARPQIVGLTTHAASTAQAPPTFAQVPRGKVAKKKRGEKDAPTPARALEIAALREKVLQSYAALKVKRREGALSAKATGGHRGR